MKEEKNEEAGKRTEDTSRPLHPAPTQKPGEEKRRGGEKKKLPSFYVDHPRTE